MADKNPPGLFITGIDTGVGKTQVACCIVRSLCAAGLRVGIYKPVASGCSTDSGLAADDDIRLWNVAGKPGDRRRVCPQKFTAPVAPHLAAQLEGKEVDGELLRTGIRYWRRRSDVVVVEGVGGLMSPVTSQEYVADLALDFAYPLVIVAANALGVINQTLQTLITAATFREGVPVAGIVLNDPSDPRESGHDQSRAFNRGELAARCVPPVLAQLAWQAEAFDKDVDWFALARPAANERSEGGHTA